MRTSIKLKDGKFLTVLQSKSIPNNVKAHVLRGISKGKFATYIKEAITNYHTHFLKSNSRKKEMQNFYMYAYIFSEKDIMPNTKQFLSRGKRYIWSRIKCQKYNIRNQAEEFIMCQPRGDIPEFEHISDDRKMELNVLEMFRKSMEYFGEENYNFVKSQIDGTYFRSKVVLNLMYLYDVNSACLLLPECLAISLEMLDQMYILREPSMSDCEYEYPILFSIDRFSKIESLGTGSSGQCFKLKSTEHTFMPESKLQGNIEFVGKEAKRSLQNNIVYSTSDMHTSRAETLNEVGALCLLYHLKNPNIVKPHILRDSASNDHTLLLYDSDGVEKKLISTMEYIEGQGLSQDVLTELKPKDKLYIAIKIAEALYVLHENGYVHYDLHGGNVILEKDSNNPIIIDFGSCERINNSMSKCEKDVGHFVDLLLCMYEIPVRANGLINIDEFDIPKVLKPILHDAVSNKIHRRRYNSMKDIYGQLSNITMKRKFIDFKHYKMESCNDLYRSEIYKILEEEEAKICNPDCTTDINLHKFHENLALCKERLKFAEERFKNLQKMMSTRQNERVINFL